MAAKTVCFWFHFLSYSTKAINYMIKTVDGAKLVNVEFYNKYWKILVSEDSSVKNNMWDVEDVNLWSQYL